MGIPAHRLLIIFNEDYNQIYKALYQSLKEFLNEWDKNVDNINTEYFDDIFFNKYPLEEVENCREYIEKLTENYSFDEVLQLSNAIVKGKLSFLKLYEYDCFFQIFEYAEYLINKYRIEP